MHREHDNWSRTEVPIASFGRATRPRLSSLLSKMIDLQKNKKYIYCGPSSREVDEKTKRKYRTILYEWMNNLLHLFFHFVSFCRWIWCGGIAAALCFVQWRQRAMKSVSVGANVCMTWNANSIWMRASSPFYAFRFFGFYSLRVLVFLRIEFN